MGSETASLRAILSRERAALAAGRLADLPALVAEKQVWLSGQPGGGAGALAGLANDLARNQRLIGAALKGVQAARARAEAIRKAAEGTRSYGADGAGRVIGGTGPTIERRA